MEPNLNRVTVGLPERVAKAKGALREYERLLEDLRCLCAQRSIVDDSAILDRIEDLLRP